MTPAREILSFLVASGETTFDLPPDHPAGLTIITGVATDASATRGQLAWISPRNAERDPDRIGRFAGSMLIIPEEAGTGPSPADQVRVPCRHPKLAFTMVVDRFFGHLAGTRWPEAGLSSVSGDAVIGSRVTLAAGVVIGSGVVIGDDVVVGPNTCLANVEVSPGVVIGANCTIGLPGFGYERDSSGALTRFPHLGRVIIGRGVEIGSNTCIDRGSLGDTVIGEGVKIDNLVHVAHNVILGRNVVVIANAMIGGSTVVEDNAWIAPSVSLRDQITVGAGATVGLGAVALKSVPAGAVVVGNPARPLERRPAG